jgi:hypothetical protein
MMASRRGLYVQPDVPYEANYANDIVDSSRRYGASMYPYAGLRANRYKALLI